MKKMNYFYSIFLVSAILFGSTYFSVDKIRAAATAPELPRVYLDTAYPTLSSSRTLRSVKNSCTGVSNCYTSLQTAIDQAILGDEIVIDAGLTINGPITLKNKSTGSGWIVIRSANLANLPSAGNRVSPIDASNMAKIVAPGSNAPAMQTAVGAHHYRIVGLEFAKVSAAAVTDTLILAGDGSSPQNTMSEVPSNLVFDRVYVHGTTSSDLKRGIGLNSASTAIIDSYISDIHTVGFDSQAIGGWNGPGPYKIFNNYLEGAGENFMLGGSDPYISNLVPSDIVFEYNYVYKPRSWRVGDPSYSGKHWTIKNLFELKNGQRALVQNNIFDGSWTDGQTGYAIVLTVRNQYDTCDWCVVRDVTFQNNIVRHSASGFQLTGHDDVPRTSALTERIKITNNLWEDINGPAWGGAGWWGLVSSGGDVTLPGPSDVELSHNTIIQSGKFLSPGVFFDNTFVPKPNTVIKDNIAFHNEYGVHGDNAGVGNHTLDVYFPGVVFTKNILIGGSSAAYNKYPGNYFPSGSSSVFQNMSAGNYKVLSAYAGAASDGKDLGADMDLINTATANVMTGRASTSGSNPTPVIGDINLDHIVNAIDYSIMNASWFQPNSQSDLNHDGIVNAIDYSMLNSNWFRTW